MLANIRENNGASTLDELFLFSSKELKSDQWQPHSQNPIISDVRSSRPAGKIFQYNNELYRPSQNSAKRYGYAININKIVTLNDDIYEEVIVSQIFPNWEKNVRATHTLNFDVNGDRCSNKKKKIKCGITGFINQTNKKKESYEETLNEMTSSIIHRGPDAQGYWFDEDKHMGLGHVRLSIIDLSKQVLNR